MLSSQVTWFMSTNREMIHSSTLTPTIYMDIVSCAFKMTSENASWSTEHCRRRCQFLVATWRCRRSGVERILGCIVPIWVLTTTGGVEEYTYRDGHENSNSNSGYYGECCLSVVV